MADAVTSQTLVDGNQIAVLKFTNVSDGSEESAVKKVDVSALGTNVRGQACSRVTIEKIWWQCNGMKVQVLFDASTDVLCIELGENQSGHHDYSSFGGLKNTKATNYTGDVNVTLPACTSGDSATIVCEWIKVYE